MLLRVLIVFALFFSFANSAPQQAEKNRVFPDEDKKYSVPQNINGTENFSSLIPSLDSLIDEALSIAKAQGTSLQSKMLEKYYQEAKTQKIKNTIFYFYSESIQPIALERFFSRLNTLKRKFPDIEGYVVMRNFPKDFKNFPQKMNSKNIQGGKMKFHPPMFQFFDIEMVPAYAIASCPIEFRFKECKKPLLVRGDISLEQAIEIFASEEKAYQPYDQYLQELK